MWDDVIIGTGNKGNSAVLVFAIEGEHSISENSVSYWISGLYLDTGMVIFKSTDEGRQLNEFVKEKAHIDQVRPWLDHLVLQYIDKDRLKNRIDHAIARAFEEGSEHRANRIREALGLGSRFHIVKHNT